MKRFMSLLAISLISTNIGCALCSSCDDYAYDAVGGLWERTDPAYGRVGSAFTPSGFGPMEVTAGEVEGSGGPDTPTPAAPSVDPQADPQPEYLPGEVPADDSALET